MIKEYLKRISTFVKCNRECSRIIKKYKIVDIILMGPIGQISPSRQLLSSLCQSKCFYQDALNDRNEQKIEKFKISYNKKCEKVLRYINTIKDQNKRDNLLEAYIEISKI